MASSNRFKLLKISPRLRRKLGDSGDRLIAFLIKLIAISAFPD